MLKIRDLHVSYGNAEALHGISFDVPNGSLVTLIGANGAGKSNILNALTWCLYGSEDHLEKYEGSKQPILNDAILASLKEGDTQSVQVIVNFVIKSLCRM